jgi:peptide/nickel transport system substrate-binding protein
MNRRIAYSAAFLAAIALGTAACSSSSTTSSTSTTPGAGTSSAAAPAAQGKPLTIVTTQLSPMTDNFNPYMATGTGYTMHVQDLLYLPLAVYNTQNSSAAPTDELGTGFSWSTDGKTLTVTVRSGVKWSDGTPATGADVAYTFQTLSEKANASMDQYQEPAVASATSSGQTATLTFATPQVANMFSILQVPIVPAHVWSTQSAPATWTDPSPVSDGPFELGTFNAQGFTLKANPDYYAASSIAVPEIDIPAYTSNATLLTPTAQGTIDWSGTSITGVQSNYISKSSNNTTWTSAAPYFADNNVVGLFFNTTKPGLNNADVRKAISDTINRQALSTTGESGNEPPASSASGMLLPAQQSFLPSSMASDLPAAGSSSDAANLMKAAGYTMVGGMWEKGGQKVTLAIQDPASYTDYNTDATLIAGQLKAAGFNASTDLDGGTNGPTEWTTNLNNGNFDAAIMWGQQGLTPYNTYDNWMDYTKSAPVGQAAGADISRFNSPAAQAALTAYSGATSASAETTALQTLAGIEESQVPVAPLLYGASWAEYSTRDYTGWPSSSNPYSDPGPNPTEVLAVIPNLKPVS